jgi:prolyl-tRNA synthetase
MSRLFGHTRRERTEADTANADLLLRAGCVDQLAAGVYTYMPLGLRVKRKVEAIIRQEMDSAGAQEVLMPAIQPLELWDISGRPELFGDTLFRVIDRRERTMVLAPTHEEAVTRLFRDHAQSYRDVPVTLYQVQTKFRDEQRPRGGLVRVREFTMKDAYSFDLDDAGLDRSYDAMFRAYARIFARCGVPTKPVEADSGAIGGKGSQEFVFITDIGEDTIVVCDNCDYAANTEKAEFREVRPEPEEPLPRDEVETPNITTIDALASFLGVPQSGTAKAVLYRATEQRTGGASYPVFAVVRGDMEVNEVKLMNALGGGVELLPLTQAESEAIGAVPGYASPVGLRAGTRVVADRIVTATPNLVAGANREGFHVRNVNYGRDWTTTEVADIALAQAGYGCPRCESGTLGVVRGIEMGHVFRLGRLYSEAFGANVLDEAGEQRVPTMGCYGIGVDRIVAAAVEAHHDDRGISWPASIAPFEVHLVGLGLSRDEALAQDAEALYNELAGAGLEVLYDDRDESPGVKFNDADLIGVPIRVTVSARNRAEGVVEVQARDATEAEKMPRTQVVARIVEMQRRAIASLVQ